MIPTTTQILFASGWIVGALHMLAVCVYWSKRGR